jgi:hypothetical protein
MTQPVGQHRQRARARIITVVAIAVFYSLVSSIKALGTAVFTRKTALLFIH